MHVHSVTPEGSTDLYSIKNDFTGPFMMNRLFSLYSVAIYSFYLCMYLFISLSKLRIVSEPKL